VEEAAARLEESIALFDAAIERLETVDPDGPLIDEIRLVRAQTLEAVDQLRRDIGATFDAER
jgi:hypothetical protein